MKHSALNKRLALAWIHDCARTGSPMPTDAAIMERFNFASEETARTLLADLADAKAIVILGAGRDRVIHVPSPTPQGFAPPPVERLTPTVVRADPAVDRLAAMILGARRPSNPVQPDPAPARAKEPAMAKTPTARSKPATETGSRPGDLFAALQEAGGSLDGLFASLLKRAEDAEAKAANAASADDLAAAIARADAADKKLATLKEMFA